MSAPITVYGIPQCDTVKKARAWLAEHGVDAAFHDFKKDGVPRAGLDRWIAALGWEQVLNRRGTTWRQLDAATQAAARDAASVAELLRRHPSAIKRPVVEWGPAPADVSVGFAPADWARRLDQPPPDAGLPAWTSCPSC